MRVDELSNVRLVNGHNIVNAQNALDRTPQRLRQLGMRFGVEICRTVLRLNRLKEIKIPG
jgi:hypothetical protein